MMPKIYEELKKPDGVGRLSIDKAARTAKHF